MTQYSNSPSLKKGFTLIELMVTMIIIVILASIGYNIMGAAKIDGMKKRAMSEIQLFSLKLNDFRLDNGFTPPSTFIGGTEPVSMNENGVYEADPTVDNYKKASRALFLAMTGRTHYNDKGDSDSLEGKNYFEPVPGQVGDPDSDGGNHNPEIKQTFEDETFSSGSYFKDPFGNPYGYYFSEESGSWKSYMSPWTFDIWSTAGQTESEEKYRKKWVGSWLLER